MYKAIDLFAGAGGLSLGFTQTNEIEIVAAFETDPSMQETYKSNHPNTDVFGDVCAVNYDRLRENYGEIDVVIGGPPCQGFSNANRQNSHAVNQNNMLVKQFIRAVTELKPKAFLMENVSMLRSDVHKFYVGKEEEKIINKYNIDTKTTRLLLLENKYFFDDAVEIISDIKKIREHQLNEKDIDVLNIIYKATKNPIKLVKALGKYKEELFALSIKYADYEEISHIESETKKAFLAIKYYYDGAINADELKNMIEPAVMFQRMLNKALEIYQNGIEIKEYATENGVAAIVQSFSVYDYITHILKSSEYGYVITNGVLCAADYGAPQKRMRFVLMGVHKSFADHIDMPRGSFNSETYRTVRDAIEDIEDVTPFFDISEDIGIPLVNKVGLGELASKLRDSGVLRNHIITKTTDVALERFKVLKQGQNFHALDDALKTNTYTDVSRTQNTIYLRLDYNKPSGTVVNVRKSMWVHPTKDRAISVREAARLQTFPDSFIFCGSKNKQYQQVGNAVPPILARALAEKILEVLKTKNGVSNG